MYSDPVMWNMRQRFGLECDDKSKDDEIMSMSKREVLTHCLEWEGIIGYTNKILKFINSIYGVELE